MDSQLFGFCREQRSTTLLHREGWQRYVVATKSHLFQPTRSSAIQELWAACRKVDLRHRGNWRLWAGVDRCFIPSDWLLASSSLKSTFHLLHDRYILVIKEKESLWSLCDFANFTMLPLVKIVASWGAWTNVPTIGLLSRKRTSQTVVCFANLWSCFDCVFYRCFQDVCQCWDECFIVESDCSCIFQPIWWC